MEDRQALIVPGRILLYHLYGSRRPPSRINPGETVDIAAVRLDFPAAHNPRTAVRGLGPPTSFRAMPAADADLANQHLVDRLVAEGSLWERPVAAAFRATPRHRFLDRVFKY